MTRIRHGLHEIILEVIVAVLITRLRDGILRMDFIVHMVPLVRLLSPLLGYPVFFFLLDSKLATTVQTDHGTAMAAKGLNSSTR